MQETVGENIYIIVILCTAGVSLLVISFVFLFIHNQNKLLKNRQQIHEAEMAHQKELMGAIIQSQEIERRRIGQDLHDEVGGSLSNLRMLLNGLEKKRASKQEIEIAADNYKQLIDKIIQDVRNIAHNLSPPALALFGFSTALDELSDVVNNGDGPVLSITNHAEVVSEQLPYETALALIRILQELISNTIKHAVAKRIGVSIYTENEQYVLHYTDDGKGFNRDDVNNKKGMGMQNMESRISLINGTYSVLTAPGEGFSVFIMIPYKV